MLSDEVRTLSYARAIASHPVIRNGGVVLGVGAGTGILSILCALAGASHVYAIEASAMAHKTASILKASGVSDVVTLFHCKNRKSRRRGSDQFSVKVGSHASEREVTTILFTTKTSSRMCCGY